MSKWHITWRLETLLLLAGPKQYGILSLHLPGHPVTAAVLRSAIKELSVLDGFTALSAQQLV
jgi:hypothetical protein